MTSPIEALVILSSYTQNLELDSTNCLVARLSDSFATPWTVTQQNSLSVGYSRQEYWSELPCPPPGDLPDLGTKREPLTNPAQVGSFPQAPPRKSLQPPLQRCTMRRLRMRKHRSAEVLSKE